MLVGDEVRNLNLPMKYKYSHRSMNTLKYKVSICDAVYIVYILFDEKVATSYALKAV